MINNKKAWIRIVEAFIAVILIASVFLIVYSNQKIKSEQDEIKNMQRAILNEMVNNKNFREDVLNNVTENINAFVLERIPSGLNFTIKICEIDDICALSEYRKEVYAEERIVSAELQQYNPKILKLFVWKED